MGDFDEAKHPRDRGKFTSVGGGAHTANASRAAKEASKAVEKHGEPSSPDAYRAKAEAHADAAGKHRDAQVAQKKAAEKETDPRVRSEHGEQANQHGEQASKHEQGAREGHAKADAHEKHDAHEKDAEKHSLSHWISEKLEKVKEGVHEHGEALRELQEHALSEGGLLKAGVEATEKVAGGAVRKLKKFASIPFKKKAEGEEHGEGHGEGHESKESKD